MFALSVTVLAVNDDTVYYIEEVGVGYNIRSCRKMINRVRYIHIVSFLRIEYRSSLTYQTVL